MQQRLHVAPVAHYLALYRDHLPTSAREGMTNTDDPPMAPVTDRSQAGVVSGAKEVSCGSTRQTQVEPPSTK